MNNIFKNSKAFTLAEISVVMIVIGVILTLTICNTINTDEYKEKHLKSKTRVFYSDLQTAYQSKLTYDTDGFDILNLKDTDNSSAEARTLKVRDLMADDMNLEYISCEELPDMANTIISITGNGDALCVESNKGFYVAINMFDHCDGGFRGIGRKETFTDDPIEQRRVTRMYNHSCGHIFYFDKNKRDLNIANDVGTHYFHVVLGRRGIKDSDN